MQMPTIVTNKRSLLLKATDERQVYCTKWHNSLNTKYTLYQGAHAPFRPEIAEVLSNSKIKQ